MQTKREVYLTAEFLIERHSTKAEKFALLQAKKLEEKGKRALAAEWIRIAQCIRDITSE